MDVDVHFSKENRCRLCLSTSVSKANMKNTFYNRPSLPSSDNVELSHRPTCIPNVTNLSVDSHTCTSRQVKTNRDPCKLANDDACDA